LRNLKATMLTGVRFYQFLHGHPANDERPTVTAAYDSTLYAGPLSSFRYDVTQRSLNSGTVDGTSTGCLFDDVIGMATEVAPGDFGLGHYRGHVDRPATGLHVDVENDTLGNQTTFGPDEVAGALRIDVASIAPNATATVRVLLAVRSQEATPNQVTVDACSRLQGTPGDPTLLLEKGPCGPASPGGPFDVIRGQLDAVVAQPGLTLLGNVQCVANDLAADRVTVRSVISACNPIVFVLARHGAGAQFVYGSGTGGAIRFPASGDCAP
jgi:hypothetical protein